MVAREKDEKKARNHKQSIYEIQQEKESIVKNSNVNLVYTFKNNIIKNQYYLNAKMIDNCNVLIKEQWGFGIDDTEIKDWENDLDVLLSKSNELQKFISKHAEIIKEYDDYLDESFNTKINRIRREFYTIVVVENSLKIKPVYEVILLIDIHDLEIKEKNEEVSKEWIEKIIDFKECLKDTSSKSLKLVRKAKKGDLSSIRFLDVKRALKPRTKRK